MNEELKVLQKFNENPKKISQASSVAEERYFVYDGKYTFSLNKVDEGGDIVYTFHSYNQMSVEEAKKAVNPFVTTFTSKNYDISYKNLFEKVYELLLSRMNGVDKIFEDILSDGEV